MKLLTLGQVTVITEVYSYDSQEELNDHFELMQQNGFIGSSVGDSSSRWATTYTKRVTHVDDYYDLI